MFGLALVLFAIMIVGTARVPRPIGYLMGLSGLAYIVQGWVLGAEGFSATNTVCEGDRAEKIARERIYVVLVSHWNSIYHGLIPLYKEWSWLDTSCSAGLRSVWR